MWQSLEILNLFITLTLERVFWKNTNSFKKLEHRFLDERPANRNISMQNFHVKSQC